MPMSMMKVSILATLVVCFLSMTSFSGCRPPQDVAVVDGDADADSDADTDSDTDADGDRPVCEDPIAEICNNGADDDCDGLIDCIDILDCGTEDYCQSDGCGELQRPEGSLELPDGACPEDESEPCEGYESSITFTGFSSGQQLENVEDILGVCVNMEHSWIRDLVIYAQCPSGVRVMLHDFAGRDGGEVFVGVPNDSDGDYPEPGTGWDYCWTPNADRASWIDYANDTGCDTLPEGDYQSSEPMNAFVGCPLNGDWTLRVEDRWGIDNGFIFSWSVAFDPDIVEDCSVW